jgi:hypothetical protein
LEVAPGEALVRAKLGRVLFELQRYDEAQREFDSAIGLGPNEGSHEFWHGRVQEEISQREKRKRAISDRNPADHEGGSDEWQTKSLEAMKRSLSKPWMSEPWERSYAEAYVKHLEGRLWEMRMTGRDGISRAIYVRAAGPRAVVVRVFVKKTEKTPRRELEIAHQRAKEVV